ncbi:MAG: leucine-rich repeat domain-containing protein [Christensenellales bacterium]
MEKKCFVALLMVVVMMCACWTGVLAEDVERETFTSGDYEYALLDDGTVEITGYNGKAEKLTIPNMLNGKKVTSIDNRAFYLCNSLISIIIPDSVEKISVNPFAYCRTLKSIFVSSEHPYFFAIDGVLFRKADSCLISYPKGREYTTYNIPQGITAIESSAFYDCKFLTRVTIPDSVTSIGDCAFSLCDSLTSITIPDSVEQIGTNPFTVCSALKSISVSPEHPYFATIDGVLFRKADKALISYPAGISSSTYTIPQGITAIGDSAFYYCDSLTSVSIPDSVTSIGDNAFYFCESLTSVTIPDSVTAIGDSAFSYCDSLTSVSIPDSVTSIGDSAFYSCDSLTSVSIPDSVTAIGNRAFYSCDSLTSVSIPNSVTAIGDRAFYYCDSLTSVSIPNSVTAIGDYAFGDCSNLTLTVPRNSYAAEYAKSNDIYYTYPDANDWLNN